MTQTSNQPTFTEQATELIDRTARLIASMTTAQKRTHGEMLRVPKNENTAVDYLNQLVAAAIHLDLCNRQVGFRTNHLQELRKAVNSRLVEAAEQQSLALAEVDSGDNVLDLVRPRVQELLALQPGGQSRPAASWLPLIVPDGPDWPSIPSAFAAAAIEQQRREHENELHAQRAEFLAKYEDHLIVVAPIGGHAHAFAVDSSVQTDPDAVRLFEVWLFPRNHKQEIRVGSPAQGGGRDVPRLDELVKLDQHALIYDFGRQVGIAQLENKSNSTFVAAIREAGRETMRREAASAKKVRDQYGGQVIASLLPDGRVAVAYIGRDTEKLRSTASRFKKVATDTHNRIALTPGLHVNLATIIEGSGNRALDGRIFDEAYGARVAKVSDIPSGERVDWHVLAPRITATIASLDRTLDRTLDVSLSRDFDLQQA